MVRTSEEIIRECIEKKKKINYRGYFGFFPGLIGMVALYVYTNQPAYQELQFAKIISDSVNLRTAPSVVNSSIIQKVSKDAKLQIIGDAATDWKMVLAPSLDTAYVKNEFVTVNTERKDTGVEKFNDRPLLKFGIIAGAFLVFLLWYLLLNYFDKKRKTVNADFTI